ncbi:hypothetical protein SAMN05421780_11042 [Flexibacter flexilis DSM 6793]|uniref:Annexin n=1 Tax=Flexibacter flexilis DSM 6793 TaxID=927664 RepID=A0A1I1M6S1_9BACT|nr:hypothetical protein [Flexibacter flexilis]SFC80746.1 hypothetical protein SAMN05421780_11042 [Flexibacter flexilis DSM 6793]
MAKDKKNRTGREDPFAALKVAAGWTALGLVFTGAGYGVYRLTRNTVAEIRQENTENQTSEYATPANYAARLMIAFQPSGQDYVPDGTDEEGVLQVAREIPDAKTYKEVMAAFSRLTKGQNLNEVARDELSSIWGNEYYDQWIMILNQKK